MSDIIAFEAETARLALPLLYPGQAQKEIFVNEALVRIDALLHGSVEGIASAPPAAPANGDGWVVGQNPSGDWTGNAGKLVSRASGNWIFVAPQEGMAVTLRATGQILRYRSGSWDSLGAIAAPQGGETVDSQARDAISVLINRLVAAGIVPPA